MQHNLLQIDELLKSPKKTIRKATVNDILYIKNELFLLLNEKNETDESESICRLINEIQYLLVNVERDDDEQIIFSYAPPIRKNKRVTIKESGWITAEK